MKKKLIVILMALLAFAVLLAACGGGGKPPDDNTNPGNTNPDGNGATYTVTFSDYNGVTLKSEAVKSGESATPPSDPARVGHDFSGWQGSYANVTQNTTVTAVYTAKTFTVIFNGYNGVTLKMETVDYGATATAPEAPQVTGYDFSGWQGSYTNVMQNTTVTAVYTAKTLTVTFKGYNDVILKTETVDYGANATAPTAPQVTGYDFTGWDKSYTNITQSTTVNAVYAIKTFSVEFKGYDGVTLKTETVNYGATATAPTAPQVPGYTFTGWDKSYAGVTSNLTVNAVYGLAQIGVKLYIDGALSGEVFTDSSKDYKIAEPEKPAFDVNNPNDEKHFYGWFLDPQYAVPYFADAVFPQNAALYAKWITVYTNAFTYTVA
ncbi:MAG: InlB B-repeat-containing protein, partial [Clostridiales bacterium]|nr:InlB B-repeat-containing protein [Clostridiales bacterium]